MYIGGGKEVLCILGGGRSLHIARKLKEGFMYIERRFMYIGGKKEVLCILGGGKVSTY